MELIRAIKLLVLGSFLSLNFSSFVIAQDVAFTELQNLPTPRTLLTSANDGENIYVPNGFHAPSDFKTNVLKYNIATDTWSEFVPLTIPKRWASSAIIGNSLYIFNGQAFSGAYNNKLEVVNLETGAVSFSTDNPHPGNKAGVATWDGKIYSFGGEIGPNLYSNKLYEFDPQTEVWTELADMPVALETKGEIISGKLYVFGGYNGSVSDRIDVYDIATNTWEASYTMPVGVSAHATAVIDDKIYLVGDYANLTFLALYDVYNNSFIELTSNLIPRRHCAAEGVNGKLYTIGGNTSTGTLTSVQVADILSGVSEPIFEIVNIYPNPTFDVLHWDIDFEVVKIIDVTGKTIEEIDGTFRKISVGRYTEGIYLLMGRKNDKWYSYKWVKK